MEIPIRDETSNPEFIIARSFDINRPGTLVHDLHGGVIAGILKKGKLKVGDTIEIKPGIMEKHANQVSYRPLKTKIVSIYRGSYPISEAGPGGSLAFETELDCVLTRTDSLSGSIASLEKVLPQITDRVRIKYRLFDSVLGEEQVSKVVDLILSEQLMLSINTTITVGKIEKINKDAIDLALRISIVPLKGDSVGIARNIHGHWRLIGLGEII